jgi:sugar (pentulose or hexulose) kinase
MQCVALDIGSSTIKGAVLDVAEGEVRRIVTTPFPAQRAGLPARHFEVDPREIEVAARSVVESLLAQAPDAQRLYVAGQMGGLLLLDQRGRPLTNYLSWQDQRTQAGEDRSQTFLERLRKRLDDNEFQSLGHELHPGSTLALLHWLGQRDELPVRATPVTVADYVVGRLCRTSGHMHLTQAIGLLDLRSLDWHHGVFERLNIGQLVWPRLVRSIEPIGQCRFGEHRLSVYGAYGDQQCALLGAGLQRDELSINISTGSQVSRRTDRLGSGDLQTRAYFHGDLLQTITHLPAGRSLNVLVGLLTEVARTEGVQVPDAWRTIMRLMDTAEQASHEGSTADLAVDLSFFAAPRVSSGSIAGITTENLTVGRLFHAAFRSMADNYVRCAARLDPVRSWSRVVLSGSLARSVPGLRRLIQQRFDVPLRESAHDEETLLGMLTLASEENAALERASR